MKKVYKYGTGQEVPEDAEYLTSVTQEIVSATDNVETKIHRFVWHYFLVKEDKKTRSNDS